MPFVPNGLSRRETAILLVGTADEFGLPQRDIKARMGGFEITEELADVLYTESAKKTSGNRAAKKNSKEE